MTPTLESFIGAVVLAAAFSVGSWVSAKLGRARRSMISASAGAAVAYVFVYLLPELDEAGRGFVDATRDLRLPLPEYRVYASALVGFVAFYGVEHLRSWSRRTEDRRHEHGADRTFGLHVGGYAAYAALVGATLAQSAANGENPVALYCVAMGLHFMGAAGELVREHGVLYDRLGKWMLAAAVLVGWAIGTFAPASPATMFTLVGLVSGGVVVNSMIMELPQEKEGRFWPFVLGAAVYALLLLLLARNRLDG
jgi:hypothetical protein